METVKYKISQAIRYLGIHLFIPFPLYLSVILGYKEDTIGLVLMILPLVGMIANIILVFPLKTLTLIESL